MNVAVNSNVKYRSLTEDCHFEANKPNIEELAQAGTAHVKRVTLKAGIELKCHKTSDRVLVLWLSGKAEFTANSEAYAMLPGSMLEMPAGTPHGAIAETDCIFVVFKFA